jgi:hypothetical protein
MKGSANNTIIVLVQGTGVMKMALETLKNKAVAGAHFY